jgi:predicted TIM-barrel fold metal-dependent hydrolase
MARLIDVHHHALPPLYLAALAELGVQSPVKGAFFPPWTPEASLEAMDAAGIETAILSVSAPGLGVTSGEHARALARSVNEYLAEVVAAHPNRFGAFALMPVDHVDAALAEVDYALDVLRLDGIGLFTSAHGTYLGDSGLEPLMRELAARAVPVHVHPSVARTRAPEFGLPASVIEFPIETTRAVANMLFSGTLDRHPGLKLILSHAGGTVPYLARRMTHAPTINPALRGGPPTDLLGSLRRLYYDIAMSATPEQLACLHPLAGPGHILFGSDFPFMPAEHAADNAAGLRTFEGFSPSDYERVSHVSAMSIFPRLRPAGAGAEAPT